MDFFRRVFNKSDSNPELKPAPASSGGDSLFGGLEVNEVDHESDDIGTTIGPEADSTPGERFVMSSSM